MTLAESGDEAFAADFKETPYWWDAAPPLAVEPEAPPREVDVAIVGAGVTGLNAAIVLARAGRSVAVFDAGDLGQGASSRNAGYLGRALKHSFRAITKKHGLEQAIAVYREMQGAFDTVLEVIASEQITCGVKRNGRFIMTKSKRQYDDLAAELEMKKQHLGDQYTMVPGQGGAAGDRHRPVLWRRHHSRSRRLSSRPLSARPPRSRAQRRGRAYRPHRGRAHQRDRRIRAERPRKGRCGRGTCCSRPTAIPTG